MNTYKQLISGHAVNLAVYGKDDRKSCFESLSINTQQELIEAYIAQLSKFDSEDMAQSVIDRLGINPAYLIGIGKLTAKDAKAIQVEFQKDVKHFINEKLTDVYLDELSNRDTHIAEYKADWSRAA